MKISRWLQLRVWWRAAYGKWLRLLGRVYPAAESHPPHVLMQPSDLATERAQTAPLRLARARNRHLDAVEWQAAARDKLTELLTPDSGYLEATESWTRRIGGANARRVYVRRTSGQDIPITVIHDPARSEPGPPLIVMLGTFSAVHLAMGEARLPYDVARLANGADIGLQAAREGYTAICVELSGLGEHRFHPQATWDALRDLMNAPC